MLEQHQIAGMVIDRLLDQQQQTLDRYSRLVDGLNDAIEEIAAQLDTLATACTMKEEHEKAAQEYSKIHTMLQRILVVVSVVGTVGIGTYVWVNKDIDARIEQRFKKELELERQAEKERHLKEIYYVDDKGVKHQLYYGDKKVEK